MHIEQLSGSKPTDRQFGTSHLPDERDFHSFSNPHQVKVQHLELECDILFEEKILHGIAVLSLDKSDAARHLILDTMGLTIVKVETAGEVSDYLPATFSMGETHPILGTPLTIQLPDEADRVRIEYFTSPDAIGLQWLAPPQTAGKRHPFMFTQSETIYARSWIPLQDSPQVRMTYHARVRTPADLLAVMSAANNPQSLGEGQYDFVMPQPIPSYLIALAVGDLVFEALGPRSGVYAEPSVIAKAAREFGDTEKMIETTERLYGPYRWDRYDMLVLPPSFPLGGMENPRLTFTTPSILAGDRSLVSVVAHELAHSWSGNLVTNATWSDFWLNEGFTVYVERRVLEELYGRQREEMEAALGRQDLEDEIAALDERSEILHIDLKDRDPEDCFTKVPYEKGALFLRQLEETFGRADFDAFLRGYFDRFAFQSITTADFVAYLQEHLLQPHPQRAGLIPLIEWLYQPGLPACAPQPSSDAFTKVEKQAARWLSEEIAVHELRTAFWTTQEWLHLLRHLPRKLESEKMRELDGAFQLTGSSNSEIAHQWLLMAIRNHYEPASSRLEEFLLTTGREKLIKPLYEELIKSSEGKQRATAIYSQARPAYHPIVVTKLDKLLNWKNE
jgi:leukotriene-A4 hydrolase